MTEAARRSRRSKRGLAKELSTDATRQRAWWLSRLFLGLAVVVAVLWQGGVDPTALWVVWGLGVLGWVASVPHVPVRRARATAGMIWIGLGAYTALLLIPLPRGLVAAVHPMAVQISDASRAALGLPALDFLPIAAAPGDAALQVGLYLIAGAIAVLYSHGLMLPSSRSRAVRDGDWVALLCAVAVALWMLAHGPWISVRLPPTLRRQIAQFALINPNHLAGLCVIGVSFAMGRMLRSVDIAHRNAYLSLAVGIGSAAFLGGSRAGALSVVFVVLANLGSIRPQWYRTRTTSDEVARRKRIDFVLKVLTGVMVAAVFALPFIEAELLPTLANGTSDHKLRLFGAAAEQVGGGWLLGQGPGALPVALGMHGVTPTARADFAENLLLERFIDQGFWGSVPFFVALTWLVVTILHTLRRGSPAIAPFLAMVGILLHNFADFSLEIAGGLLPFLIAASLAERLRTSRQDDSSRRHMSSKRTRTIALGSSLAALLLGGAALASATGSTTRAAAAELAQVDLSAGKQLVAERFSHDHYAFFLLCREAVDGGDYKGAVTLCSRSLTLWPGSEATRLVRFAASLDAKDDRFLEQDLVALLRGSRAYRARALEICAQQPGVDATLTAAVLKAPDTSYKVGRALAKTRPDLVERLALALRATYPDRVYGIEVVRGELYMQRGLLREADRIATALMANAGTAVHGWELQAQIYMHQQRYTQAMQLFDIACQSAARSTQSCLFAMKAAARALPPRQALRYVRRHFGELRGHTEMTYAYWLLLAQLYIKLEDYEDAIAAAQRAHGLQKQAPEAIALNATAQLRVGDWRTAAQLIDRLPKLPAWEKVRAELAAEVSETRETGRL